MNENEGDNIREQAYSAAHELCECAGLKKGQIMVIGCSTSEVVGSRIGTNSDVDVALELFLGIKKALDEAGVYLAAQCCEHLNRALILDEAAAERFGYEIVNVRPWAHAGGSFATALWERLERPAAVEHIRAKAGMDIGATLIGMHLKEVAVPLRLSVQHIGEASLVCARTRPRFIGGERAHYQDELK